MIDDEDRPRGKRLLPSQMLDMAFVQLEEEIVRLTAERDEWERKYTDLLNETSRDAEHLVARTLQLAMSGVLKSAAPEELQACGYEVPEQEASGR